MQEGFDEFWRVVVAECKKTKYFENWNFVPLKIVFFYMSRVNGSPTSREPTHEMCRCTGQIFAS